MSVHQNSLIWKVSYLSILNINLQFQQNFSYIYPFFLIVSDSSLYLANQVVVVFLFYYVSSFNWHGMKLIYLHFDSIDLIWLCLEMTFVVIWCNINKTELNRISYLWNGRGWIIQIKGNSFQYTCAQIVAVATNNGTSGGSLSLRSLQKQRVYLWLVLFWKWKLEVM